MKRLLMFLPGLFLLACTTSYPPEIPYTMPRLIEQSAMPALPPALVANRISLQLNLQIGENGSVLAAILENSSGNEQWDSLAIEKIRQWKYAPATANHKPIRIWIKQVATIQYEDALTRILAEIACDSLSSADSAHEALEAGARFTDVVTKYSVDVRRLQYGLLGEVDVHRYPYDVQRELRRLGVNEFTRPILLGRQYVIFKRLASSEEID